MKEQRHRSTTPSRGQQLRLVVALFFFGVVTITTVLAVKFAMGKQTGRDKRVGSTNSIQGVSALPTNEVGKALMVTVELDFGPATPSIAEALKFIERRYEPDDKVGRTFAILDAYGEATSSGKLHISMHVSLEKPGIGSLVFNKTGEVLWKSRIVMGEHSEVVPLNKRTLLILVDDGTGKSLTIDGSNNPATILDANIKELSVPLSSVWADGTDREFTYLYSACGCPVKAMVRRTAAKTIRAKELPVMFPDDPGALAVIKHLMTWD
jgi:hypothetical protein